MPLPWSRHDLAFAASAVVLLVATGVLALAGWAAVDGSARFSVPLTVPAWILAVAVLVAAVLPFGARRGAPR